MVPPLQITFRHMDPSPALEERIRRRADELGQFCDRITSCRVVVERRHQHHQQGNLFDIHVTMTIPKSQLVIGRTHRINQAHEDAYVAVRDAFDAARRQLEDHVRGARSDEKHSGAARQSVSSEPG